MGHPGDGRRAAPAQGVMPKLSPSSLQTCGFPPVARYCELDTLTMVMVYEALRKWVLQVCRGMRECNDGR